MNKNGNYLELMSSEIFNNESLNLSFFKREMIDDVLSLKIIEDHDVSLETLNKYKYFDHYFILKVGNNFYFVNSSYIDTYYNDVKPLKLNDYHVYQRKDKLKKILDKTKEEE